MPALSKLTSVPMVVLLFQFQCRALCRGTDTRFAPVSRSQKERVPARERDIQGKNLPPHRRRARIYDGGMSPGQRHPNGLGDFLKARRAQLTPHQVGLPDTGSHRKVAGLRREEVAQLAAISVDYLTRLEQGRVQASASVLITLSRALRLDDDQQAYLYELAGKTPRPRRRPAQKARPAMPRLIGQLTETPAVVLGRRLDILVWNAGAAALYTDSARIPARRRNYVRLLFTDPAVRALHTEWEHDARTVVASLRME